MVTNKKQGRRQALDKEKFELNQLVNELTTQINEINSEIVQLQLFLRNIRQKIFGEIDRELINL